VTRDELRAAVRALVAEHADVPDDDRAGLDLESFTVVVLAEELEPRFGVSVRAPEVVKENFGSIARLVDYLAKKLGLG
jgi:acyl carrier protein